MLNVIELPRTRDRAQVRTGHRAQVHAGLAATARPREGSQVSCVLRLGAVLQELDRYVATELAVDDPAEVDSWVTDEDALALRAVSL